MPHDTNLTSEYDWRRVDIDTMRRKKQRFPEPRTFLYKSQVSPLLIIVIVNTMIINISV